MGEHRAGEHDEPEAETFGSRLRAFRRRRLWTQEMLAERSNIPVRTISSLESGFRKNPHLTTVTMLADALGLSDDERERFVTGTASAAPAAPAAPNRGQVYRLPDPATPFVGRRDLLAQALDLLRTPRVRLLTLVGPGGIGKTRVALRLAEELAAEYPDGVCFVDLAPMSDHRLVASATAQALAAPTPGHESAEDAVVAFCREKALLLLLDNMERLLEAGAFIDRLLGACPRVTVLVTSRERIGIAREQVFPIQPMSLPETLTQGSPAAQPVVISSTDAIDLFVARARAADPAYFPTVAEVTDIAAVCAHLDGIPLAIELAAARISHFGTANSLLTHLDHRLPLLTGGPDRSDRHRTMRAAIDWSYVALAPIEQAMLRHLSVFPGGCTLEAALIVWRDAPWIALYSDADAGGDPAPIFDSDQTALAALLSLVDKSLLQTDSGHRIEPRYRMLDTIREYGQEQLAVSGEEDAVRGAFARYGVDLAERGEQGLTGADQATWMARLESEHDNLRAALLCLIDGQEAEEAMRLGSALWPYWSASGRLKEGKELLEGAVSAGGTEADARRATALLRLGNLAVDLADYPSARSSYTKGLAIARAQPDTLNVARALTGLGIATLYEGDYGRARAFHETALQAWTEIGHPRGVAATWLNLGNVSLGEGDLIQARQAFETAAGLKRDLGDSSGLAWVETPLGVVCRLEKNLLASRSHLSRAISLFRAAGDRLGEGYALHELGNLSHDEQDSTAALSQHRAALAIRFDAGDEQGIVDCLEGIAAIQCRTGEPEKAVLVLSAAARWRTSHGVPAIWPMRAAHEHILDHARSLLNSDTFVNAWANGQAMTLAQARDSAVV